MEKDGRGADVGLWGQVPVTISVLSRMMVTGPSFTSETCIIAWKRPVSTWGTCWRRIWTNFSKASRA